MGTESDIIIIIIIIIIKYIYIAEDREKLQMRWVAVTNGTGMS